MEPPSNSSDGACLDTLFEQLIEAYDNLLSSLAQERNALTRADTQQLALATEQKQQHLAKIEPLQQALTESPLIEHLHQKHRSTAQKLDELHNRLVVRAQQAQEYNLVNGKILQRSQQSVRELIQLISTADTEPLYSDQGQTTSSPSQGIAIAKA